MRLRFSPLLVFHQLSAISKPRIFALANALPQTFPALNTPPTVTNATLLHHRKLNTMSSITGKLATLTIPASGEHKSTMIYLHGLGDTGHGWSSLVENFRLRSLFANTKFVFPHAPTRPITCNGGMRMPGWYDIPEFRDLMSQEDEEGLNQSKKQIMALVQAELDNGIPASNIVLGGFSQGAVTSLYTGLTLPYAIGGVICMSGYLPLRNAFKDLDRAANQNTKIFMGHGEQDMVVRYSWGVLTKDTLKGLGYDVEWHSYHDLDHSANTKEINDLEGWLAKRIGRNGDGNL